MARRPYMILGAGLTGLSAARHLPEDSYRLFEREARVGGLAVTSEQQGYRFDRTGHLLHLRDPEMRSFVLGLLGDELVEVERRAKIYSHGVYTDYPFQANTFGLPRSVVTECLVGFIRAQSTHSGTPARTFEDFILRHFGEGIARHFMIPYNRKIWGVHPREMTCAWCDRFVPLPRVEDIVAGALGPSETQLGYNARFLYPRRGIGTLSEALGRQVEAELRKEPVGIDPAGRVVKFAGGEVASYEVLISTIPLPRLIGLMGTAPPQEIRRAATTLRHNPLWYLDVALTRAPEMDLHWVYVPEERFPFYRVGAYTSFSRELAPPGAGSLYVELASREAPSLRELVPALVRDLTAMGLLRSQSDIAFVEPRYIECAYVVYDHAHTSATAAVLQYLEDCKVVSTGRFGAWGYSSMEDALVMGREAARRALDIG